MGIGDAVLLGLLQGLTEFLPVSSSGHLVLGKTLLGVPEQGITFEVFVHFGTLLAVVTIFAREIYAMIRSLFMAPNFLTSASLKYRNDSDFQMLIFLIIGTIPAAAIGLLFEQKIEQAFQSPRLVCIMLICTGIILLSTWNIKNGTKKLNTLGALIIGLAQAVAILPGISRSGSTISSGLHLTLNSEKVAFFSFLLSVPAILGATLLKLHDMIAAGISRELFIILAVGTITSYITGYIAIETLLKIIRKGKLYWFAPYCILLGIIGFILL